MRTSRTDGNQDKLLAELASGLMPGKRGATDHQGIPSSSAGDQAFTHFVRLGLRIARKLPRFFELPHPTAPGMSFIGAEIDPSVYIPGYPGESTSASGRGLQRMPGILSCLGEASETLSQQLWGDETFVEGRTAPSLIGMNDRGRSFMLEAAGHKAQGAAHAISWQQIIKLRDQTRSWAPATLCYRYPQTTRVSITPRVRAGTGCGAGATLDDAQAHGILELIERDAVALWWLGGRQARRVPQFIKDASGADAMIAQLRRRKIDRVQWLLDLTTEFGIPTIASLSCDRSGSTLACGFASRLSWEAAIQAAILEMCQMEFAVHIVLLKKAREGEYALSGDDWTHLARCRDIVVSQIRPLQEDHAAPARAQTERSADIIENPPMAGTKSRRLAAQLGMFGYETFFLDLTREALGVPTVKVFVPGLQPLPSSFGTRRLHDQVHATGGGPGLKNGIDLI